MKSKLILALFAICLIVATFIHWVSLPKFIENDLMNKATSLLSKEGVDVSGVEVDGHRLIIPSDLALSDELYSKLDKITGVYIQQEKVEEEIETIEHVEVVTKETAPIKKDAQVEEVKNEEVTDKKIEKTEKSVEIAAIAPVTPKINLGHGITADQPNQKAPAKTSLVDSVEGKAKIIAAIKAQRAEKQAKLDDAKKVEAEKQAKLEAAKKAEAEKQAKLEAAKKAEAEKQAKLEAAKKAEAEKQAKIEAAKKVEAENQAKLEAAKKAEAEKQAKIEAAKKVEAEKQAKIEAAKKVEAENQAKLEAAKKAEAAKKVEAEKQVKLEAAKKVAAEKVAAEKVAKLKATKKAELAKPVKLVEAAKVVTPALGIKKEAVKKAVEPAKEAPKKASAKKAPVKKSVETKEIVAVAHDYGFRVERNNRTEIVAIGDLPSKEAQSALLTTIRKSAGGVKVVDQTKVVGSGQAGSWWDGHLKQIAPGFFTTSKGFAYLDYKNEEFASFARFADKGVYQKALMSLSEIPEAVSQSNTLLYSKGEAVQPVAPQKSKRGKKGKMKNAPAKSVKKASAPVKRAPAVLELAKSLKLLPVYFETGSSEIKAEDEDKIKLAAKSILESKAKNQGLTVGGYADKRGDEELNKKLSLARAESVKTRLVELGVNPERLILNHFGEDVTGIAEADLWKSRRVEISLTPLKD